MVHSMRRGQRPALVFGLVFGLVAVAAGATPALAASVPFSATYDEQTTIRPACPPNTPPKATCFTGVGTGPTVPPGGTGTEFYAGFVDPNTPGAIPGCAVDHNAVAIKTDGGTLFLTTTGSACGAFDKGTWQAFGGTGSFEGATGTGTVDTAVLGPNPDGTIHSISTYGGTLNLHSD
jgi:hypothetical protein